MLRGCAGALAGSVRLIVSVVLLLTFLGPAATPALALRPGHQSLPIAHSIELVGATVYGRDEILYLLELSEGAPLGATAGTLAAKLQTRYRSDGYPAARVTGLFQNARLRFEIDEGRLARVEIPGLHGAQLERARRQLALEPGTLLVDVEIEDALERLEKASGGALRFPSHNRAAAPQYVIESGEHGSTLVIQAERPRFALRPGFSAPGIAGRNNRVDGLNVGLGFDLTLHDRGAYHHTTFYLRDAWALGEAHFRFAAGALRQLGERVPVIVGYEFHDLTDKDDEFRQRGLEEAHGETLLTESLSDYFRRRGHEAYAFLLPTPRFELGLSWRRDRYESLQTTTRWTLFDATPPKRNLPVEEGQMSSIIGSLRLTSAAQLDGRPPHERRPSLLHRSLYGTFWEPPGGVRFEATLEIATRGLGGNFHFKRAIAQLRTRHRPFPRHRIDTRWLAGWSSGDVPRQKVFAVGGNGTLRGYALASSSGSQFSLLTAEWSFACRSSWPRVIAFYDGGAAWGEPSNDVGWRDSIGFGARWPESKKWFVRVDVAYPLDEGSRGARTSLQIQFPL
jgi:hypothetical protein